jgi:hypothetical protein
MADHMTSPGERQPPKDWWLENACRIAAFRLRQSQYLSANTIPIREQVKDSVEFCAVGVGRDRMIASGGRAMITPRSECAIERKVLVAQLRRATMRLRFKKDQL